MCNDALGSGELKHWGQMTPEWFQGWWTPSLNAVFEYSIEPPRMMPMSNVCDALTSTFCALRNTQILFGSIGRYGYVDSRCCRAIASGIAQTATNAARSPIAFVIGATSSSNWKLELHVANAVVNFSEVTLTQVHHHGQTSIDLFDLCRLIWNKSDAIGHVAAGQYPHRIIVGLRVAICARWFCAGIALFAYLHSNHARGVCIRRTV